MGYTMDDLMREIQSLKDDEVASRLYSFLDDKLGEANIRHTSASWYNSTIIDQDKFLKIVSNEFDAMLDVFAKNGVDSIKSFSAKYKGQLENIYNDVKSNIKFDQQGRPLLGTEKGGIAPTVENAAWRTIQSRIHSAKIDLDSILQQSHEIQKYNSQDKGSNTVYSQGKAKYRQPGFMNIEQDKAEIERIRKTQGSKSKNSTFNYNKSNPKSGSSRTFFDFETVGDLGGKNFGVIEMAAKTAKGMQNAFFQLGDDAANAIKSTIADIRKTGTKGLNENAVRSVKRMLDYTLNDDNTISALHKDLEGIELTKDSPLLDYAEQMVNVFQTMQGIDGQAIKNIQAFENGKRRLKGHAKTISKMLGSGTRVGHNIRGFDNQILKLAGIKGVNDIDTLTMAKSMFNIGDKDAITGKRLTSYSLSKLADFLGIDSNSLSGAAHTGEYDVDLNEKVFEAMAKRYNQTSSGKGRTITNQMAAKAKKSYFRRGALDYKETDSGKPIYMSDTDYYSANRFMRAGTNYQYMGSSSSGVDGYDYYQYQDMETGEKINIMMSPEEHSNFIDTIFGGTKGFRSTDSVKKFKSASEVFNNIASSGYGYSGFKSLFKQDKDGKIIKDTNGKAMWKDKSDKLTEFRRSQLEQLVKTTGSSNGSGSKAIDIVGRLSELEAQGWSVEELDRIVSQSYGHLSDEFTLDDLGLKSFSGYRRANALKKYIRGNADNFNVGGDNTELQDMITALDQLAYSDNVDAELANIESWITRRVSDNVKKSAVKERQARYNVGSRNIEDVISQMGKMRGGAAHASKFYNELSGERADVRRAEIAGKNGPTILRNGTVRFASGSVGDSIQRIADAAKSYNFGFTTGYNESGALEFGFYDPRETGVFDENGQIVKSKIKTVAMPTQDESNMGDIIFDNMRMANFRNRHYDVGTGETYQTTAQEDAIKAFADYVTATREFKTSEGKTVEYNPFASGLFKNPESVIQSAKRRMRDVFEDAPSIGGSSVAQEAQDLVKSGATVEQHLFRSGIVHNQAYLTELIQSTEAGREAIAQNGEQYKSMLTTLNTYMGIAVNDAEMAEQYLKTQDTSWMGDSKKRITSSIQDTIKKDGDFSQNLKEEHGAQAMYTSQNGYPRMIPGGKQYFGRTAEQAWSGTAQASEAADQAVEDMFSEKAYNETIFKNSMITRDWFDAAKQYGVNIGHDDINGGATGARYALYKYGVTTDSDIMEAYRQIAQDANVSENIRKLAQQKIDGGMVKSVANDSMAFLGDNNVRAAMGLRNEKNRNISEEDAIKLFGDEGFFEKTHDFAKKNLDKYNKDNGTNFGSFDELLKGMKEGTSLTFEDGFQLTSRRTPQFKNGKPIYQKGDFIDSLTMQNGVLRIGGHTYDPLSSKRYFMGNTKGTTTGISHKLSDDEVALNKALSARLFGGDQNVSFATEAKGKLDARKVMTDLMDKISYIKNTLVDPEVTRTGQTGVLDAFWNIDIGNGRIMKDLTDSDGFWKNDFSDENPENIAAMMRTLVNGSILDDFGNEYFTRARNKNYKGLEYSANIRAGTMRGTDDSRYFDTGSKYKWNVKSQQSLENSLKDLNSLGLADQSETDAFLSNFNQSKPTAYGEAVRGAIRQTAGRLREGEGNYIDILSPDEYTRRQLVGEDMANYINAKEIGDLVYDDGGYVNAESLKGSWGKVSDIIKARSETTGRSYQARVNLDAPVEEIFTDHNGKVIPLATSQIVLPNVDGSYGEAAILGSKLINTVGKGGTNSRKQIAAARNYLRETHNDVNNKEGATWQAENARKINTSMWNRAVGTNVISDLKSMNDRGAYGVINTQKMIDALIGYDGEKQGYSFETPEDYIQHYTNLARELYFAENQLRENGNMPQGQNAMFANEDELNAYTNKLQNVTKLPKHFGRGKHLEMAKRLASYTSVDREGGPLYAIESMLSRLPILSRRGEHGVNLYTSDNVDYDNMMMNQALQNLMNGDFDGDAIRSLLTSLQSGAQSYDEFKGDKKVAQALQKMDSQAARELIAMNAAKDGYGNLIDEKTGLFDENQLNDYIDSLPKTKLDNEGKPINRPQITKEQINAISDTRVKGLATWMYLADKQYVSQFSNMNYGMRNAMRKAGVNADVADLALAAMQLPEQQAISAKHKIENLVNEDKTYSVEELEQLRTNVENVLNAQNEAANAKGNTGFGMYANALEKAGFTKGGSISDNPALSALAPMMANFRLKSFNGGPSVKSQIESLLTDTLGISADKVSEYADSMLRGEIAGEVWQSAMNKANTAVSSQNYGNNLFNVARQQKNKVSSSRAYEGSELYTIKRHMDRAEKYNSATAFLEEGQSRYEAEGEDFASGNMQFSSNANALDASTAAFERHAAAIQAAEAALSSEMKLEAQKAGIAGKEGQAVLGAGEAYGAAADNIDKANEAYKAHFATLNENHKYMKDGKEIAIADSNTGIISTLTGKSSSDTSAINALSKRIDNGSYAKIAGTDLLDVSAYGEDLVNFWKSGDFGTAVHKELEVLDNLKGMLKSAGVSEDVLAGVNSMAQMSAVLTQNGYALDDNGLVKDTNSDIAKTYNDYVAQQNEWYGKNTAMFGQDEANSILTRKAQAVTDLSQLMGAIPGETVATELSMVAGFGKNKQYAIGNTLDFLKFDEATGVATIGDHKTTKGLYGGSLAQQLSVERYSIEDLLGQIRSHDGLKKDDGSGASVNKTSDDINKMSDEEIANIAKEFGLSDIGTARKLFKMASYGDQIIWRGKALHSGDNVSEGADIDLLSRAEVDANVERAIAQNPWTAAEIQMANKRAIGGKKKLSHGSQIERKGAYSGLYGEVEQFASGIKDNIEGLTNDIDMSDFGTNDLNAKSFFTNLMGAVDDYYAIKNKIDSGEKLTKKDQGLMATSSGIISSAQSILSNIDKGGETNLNEDQIGILREILQAYAQINQEAVKIKTLAQEYQNISNQILAIDRQRAILESQIQENGGKKTKEQEAALRRLEEDRAALVARKNAYKNRDGVTETEQGIYGNIDTKEDDTRRDIDDKRDADTFIDSVAGEYKTASEKEAEAGEVAPTGYTAIDELDSVRTMGKLNKAFTAYGDSIGRYFANFFENAYDPDADVSGLFDRWGTEETDKYNQIKAKYGTDKRGIMWRSKKGILSDDEIAADRDFVKQYKNGLKDGTIAKTTSFYDELVKASPDLMPSVGELTPFMSLVDRINMSIADMAPDGQTYKGINVTEDGLADLIKRDGSGGQSAYDMIRADYEEAVSEGRAYKGMLPTEDEINSYLTHQGQMSVLKNVDKSGYANLLKLQESMNQYGALMNESKDGLLDPDQIMQMSDLMSTITSLRSIFTSGDTGEEASLIASKMFAQFDKMGVAASIDGDISQLMYGTIDKDFNKHDSTKALKNHMNTYATLRNKQILGEQLNDNELSQMFESKKAIDAARTNVTNGTLVGDELASTRELLIMWNQIRQAVEGVKGQVSEYTSLTNQALSVDKQIYAIKAKIATEGRSATQAEQDRLTELQKQKAEIEARRAGMKKDAAPEFLESAKNIDSRYGYAQVQAQEKAASDAPILIEKENQEILKQQKQAMKSGIGSHKNYDAAELNILRAQKALETAQKSGNQQQIDAAQQQLEGARAQAGIASQYKPSFTMNEDGTGTLKTFDQETQQWKETNLAREQALKYQNDLNLQTAKHQQAVGKIHAPVKTLGSLVGEVLGGIKQTTAYLMRTSLVYGIIGKVKQAFSTLVQTVKALNKSYVDLRIASGQTDSQMKDTMKIYSQMASEMGKTTQEVAAAANDWLRAGYNAEESAKLIKNSMQLSTVGMIDSAKATEYLISTMKGWKLGVDDMEGVIDKMSELDRNEINNMAYRENGKSYPLNCWEILKLDKLQRNDEICVNVICDESRKNYQDDTRLKPKCYYNRCSAAKLRIEESSTINRLVSGVGMKANVIPKRWAPERAMI